MTLQLYRQADIRLDLLIVSVLYAFDSLLSASRRVRKAVLNAIIILLMLLLIKLSA